MISKEMIRDLGQQHLELRREGYDGHRKHSGITGMHTLSTRRNRRKWNRGMKDVKEGWNSHAHWEITSNILDP